MPCSKVEVRATEARQDAAPQIFSTRTWHRNPESLKFPKLLLLRARHCFWLRLCSTIQRCSSCASMKSSPEVHDDYTYMNIHKEACRQAGRQTDRPTDACPNHNNVRVSRAYDYQSIHAQTIITNNVKTKAVFALLSSPPEA